MTTIDQIAEYFNFGRVLDPGERAYGPWLTAAYSTSFEAARAILCELGIDRLSLRYEEFMERLEAGETFEFRHGFGDRVYIGSLV